MRQLIHQFGKSHEIVRTGWEFGAAAKHAQNLLKQPFTRRSASAVEIDHPQLGNQRRWQSVLH